MRKNKLFALLMSGLITVSAMPVVSVSAEEYALGDIDMDGVITEHDAAILYRILDEETGVIEPGYRYSNDASKETAEPLSEEQKVLADMNDDGVIDYTDADIILEKSEYKLGDVNMDGEISVEDAGLALYEYAYIAAGFSGKNLTKVQENLAAVSAKNEDWTPSVMDASNILSLYVWNAAGLTKDDLKDQDRYYSQHNYFYIPG